MLLSFCASLLFQVTQITGLFFIYPRPYRLFEVDDLMTNTFGGLLGYWIAGPLTRWLPTHDRMNEVAYRRSSHVSVTRRLTAAIVDWILIFAFITALFTVLGMMNVGFPLLPGASGLTALVALYAACVTIYFILGEWLLRGRTIGKRLMRLKLIDDRDGSRPKLWQCAVRYFILYLVVAPLPAEAVVLLAYLSKDADGLHIWEVALCALLGALFLAFVVWVIVLVLTHSNQLPHGELSKTRNVNTLRKKDVKAAADEAKADETKSAESAESAAQAE